MRQALGLIEATLAGRAAFEPATTDRVFRLHMSDIGEMVFLPPLLERLHRIAPGARVETRSTPQEEIEAALAAGELDLAVGFLPGLRPPLRNARLFVDPYVCMMRAGHPRIGDALTRKLFLEASHALVASIGAGHRVIEETLLEHGLSRRIALRVPHFMVVPMILERTDLVVTRAVAGRAALREDGAVQVAEAAGEDRARRRSRALARALRQGRREPVVARADRRAVRRVRLSNAQVPLVEQRIL